MQIYLVSFTTTCEDDGYLDLELRQIRLNKSAKKFGVNHVISWNRQQLLKTPFYKDNRKILDQKKGVGFFLWKPYIIYDTLMQINEGDVVIYCDNAMIFIDNPMPVIELCIKNKGVFLQEWHVKCSVMAKRDAFHYMSLDTEEYHNALGCQSNIQIYQKNQTTTAFVSELLNYCKDERIITNQPDVCGKPPLPDFDQNWSAHLADMYVLSLLKNKYKIETFRCLYQFGNHLKSEDFRVPGEWLATEDYDPQPRTNSPYGTIFQWDKQGIGATRPISHYLNLSKLYSLIRRKLGVIM